MRKASKHVERLFSGVRCSRL